MPNVGWGAVLQGKATDLEDWAYVLKEGFDPWVEVHEEKTVLRSASLDTLETANDVRDRAEVMIERLNGAVALSQGAGPIRFGGVVEFAPDGRLHQTIFAELYENLNNVKLRATATVMGPDGQPVAPLPPQATEVQSGATIVENHPLLEDALIYFGRASDWFDIYKTLECLILQFGGKKNGEARFLALEWAPKREIERLKQSANWPRHARQKYDRPQDPMDIRGTSGKTGGGSAFFASLTRRPLIL
jgi:hypothetical protein